MQDIKIASIQADLVWEDAAANRYALERKIAEISEPVDLIVLPETFTTGFPVDPSRFAETEDGETFAWLKKTANHQGSVICGSLLMAKAGKYFNTFVWMRPDMFFSTVEKRHLFRMGGEHQLINAGIKKLILSFKGWNIRPLVCYDLRFPTWSRNKFEREKYQYDLLIYVANWPAVRSYPWKQLLIARAIENQSFVLGVNRVGVDFYGNDYSGDSCLVDPKGNVIAMAAPHADVALISTLKAQDLLQCREDFKVGLDWD